MFKLEIELNKREELLETINDRKDFPIFRNSSGIYCIHNTISNLTYFGKSLCVRDRLLQHRNDLRNKKHCNKRLQRDYLKFGEENFVSCLMQECSPTNLELVEKMFINYYKTTKKRFGYNQRKG